jgi:hypothetical protein
VEAEGPKDDQTPEDVHFKSRSAQLHYHHFGHQGDRGKEI